MVHTIVQLWQISKLEQNYSYLDHASTLLAQSQGGRSIYKQVDCSNIVFSSLVLFESPVL